MDRRNFLGGVSALLAAPALAQSGPLPAIVDYETGSGGHVGIFAENLRNRRTIEWRADERFVMCSTFKASLAACVLSQVDDGRARLEDLIRYGAADIPDWHAPVARANLARGALSVGEMCRAAVEESDNTTATSLLVLDRIGGPAALTAFWRRLGDRISRLDAPEPYLNRTPAGGVENTTTPEAMAGIVRTLVLGPVLSPSSKALLREWLVGCKTGDNRLRAGLPKSWAVGNKTGNNGADAAGDIAIVWPRRDVPIVIAVYTRGGHPTESQKDAVFAGIARAVAVQLA